MKKEQLSEIIGKLDDSVLDGKIQKRRRYPLWIGSIAAVLAIAVLVAGIFGRVTPSALCVAAPDYPSTTVEDIWTQLRTLKENGADFSFFNRSMQTVLGNAEGKNVVYSPLNLYFALSMLAECTEGESRRQILDVLHIESVEALRETVRVLWQASYAKDNQSRATLANSLWLSEAMTFKDDTVKTLAQDYYASVFTGKMGSDELNEALQEWLNAETGGLLQEQTQNAELSAEALIVLASTLTYQTRWQDEFDEKDNIDGVFHGTAGDKAVTFMCKDEHRTYYQGDNFSAISLQQSNGGAVWLILPTEGVSAEEVAASEIPMKLVNWELDAIETGNPEVRLRIPKFDLTNSLDLKDTLEAMGIEDVFDMEIADFDGILTEECGAFLNQVRQDTRLAIDEQGVTAAAFTIQEISGEAMPEDEIVDFILDRPFLVVVTGQYNLPVMSAVVNTIG